jgi:Rrf2 family protein
MTMARRITPKATATIVRMRLSARSQQAIRPLIELAVTDGALVPAEQLAREQDVPGRVLEMVLTELCRAGLVETQRGPDGGFRLARPAAEISLAEVVTAISAL